MSEIRISLLHLALKAGDLYKTMNCSSMEFISPQRREGIG
jgi:hypothetical protein